MTGAPRHPPPPAAVRLAVVEDDAELRDRILLPALQAAGFEATGFARALDLYREWTRAPFAMVLLDVGLPDEDGVEIARHLRTLAGTVGIVVYSAHGRGVDRLRGLRAGIDAYLVKPLEVDEVVETLRNLARRCAGPGAARDGRDGWALSKEGWVLETPSGAQVALTRNEREAMVLLAGHAGQPVSREMLATRLGDGSMEPHRLEMLVYRLRRKCEAAGHPLALATVRGAGYRLDW